jgi:probable phosphoglycerate mutase
MISAGKPQFGKTGIGQSGTGRSETGKPAAGNTGIGKPAPGKTQVSLYLVRHGETEWSLSGRHTGRTDIPLTAHGEDQARQLAPWLTQIQFSHVLTSPRQRARRTCALGGLGASAAIEPDLAEWDYGDYEGKLTSDIREERPDWNIFRDGCPGGEMPDQVAIRADRLIARLRAMEGNVALFSHGEFGVSIAARWIGSPVSEARHFLLGTASLSILGYNPHHPDVSAIALWNVTPALFGA